MIFCNIKCACTFVCVREEDWERRGWPWGVTFGEREPSRHKAWIRSSCQKQCWGKCWHKSSAVVFTASAVGTTQWVNKHTILILIPMKTTCGSVTFCWFYLEKPSQIKLLHHFIHVFPFNQLMLATSFPVKLKPHIKDKINLVLSRKQTQMHLLLYWRPTHLHTTR